MTFKGKHFPPGRMPNSLLIGFQDMNAFTPLCEAIWKYLDDKMVVHELYGGYKSDRFEKPIINHEAILIKIHQQHISFKMFIEVVLVEIRRLVEAANGKVKFYSKKRNKYWVVEIKPAKTTQE